MFVSTFALVRDLNSSLKTNPDKIHKEVLGNKKEFVRDVNAMLKYYGEGKWSILVVFADRNATEIERFDAIDHKNDTQIVCDPNFTDWFDKRLKRRYNRLIA